MFKKSEHSKVLKNTINHDHNRPVIFKFKPTKKGFEVRELDYSAEEFETHLSKKPKYQKTIVRRNVNLPTDRQYAFNVRYSDLFTEAQKNAMSKFPVGWNKVIAEINPHAQLEMILMSPVDKDGTVPEEYEGYARPTPQPTPQRTPQSTLQGTLSREDILYHGIKPLHRMRSDTVE